MASRREQDIDHILRRVGFGATQEEVDTYAQFAFGGATLLMARLLSFEQIADDVDDQIGKPGYVGITARGEFQPAVNIADARQRWLFRMVHTQAPAAGEDGALLAQPLRHRLHARSPATSAPTDGDADAGGQAVRGSRRRTGQLELFREDALGNFRDLLIDVAQDPAMLVWLDGRTNMRAQPQENFGREMMELFTMGVGTFTGDRRLRGRARVHRLEPGAARLRRDDAATTRSSTSPAQHDTDREGVHVPDLSGRRQDDSRRAPRRPGMQDGLDLIDAAGASPGDRPAARAEAVELLRQRGRRPRTSADRRAGAASTTQSGTRSSRAAASCCCRRSSAIPANYYTRYSWPVGFVVRAIKEVGWAGLLGRTTR